MHPNAFLTTLWRTEIKPQVFVAMSFQPEYDKRFESVFKPAIESLEVDGQKLAPFRVDISASGDSILTQIVDGIAHSQLVLADVSTVGKDSESGRAYRNGNVMYEVGIALACRHSSEVLLLRDDQSDFLFDVSTIPHETMDFTNDEKARDKVNALLRARLAERTHVNDARVFRLLLSLDPVELAWLEDWSQRFGRNELMVLSVEMESNVFANQTVGRLLDKGVITWNSFARDDTPIYGWTALGYAAARWLPLLKKEKREAEPQDQSVADPSPPEEPHSA